MKFIKENPGARIGEIADNCEFLDGFEFLETMTKLFAENAVVEDSGHYFSDEKARLGVSY